MGVQIKTKGAHNFGMKGLDEWTQLVIILIGA
jgi:hypothetical protein